MRSKWSTKRGLLGLAIAGTGGILIGTLGLSLWVAYPLAFLFGGLVAFWVHNWRRRA